MKPIGDLNKLILIINKLFRIEHFLRMMDKILNRKKKIFKAQEAKIIRDKNNKLNKLRTVTQNYQHYKPIKRIIIQYQ